MADAEIPFRRAGCGLASYSTLVRLFTEAVTRHTGCQESGERDLIVAVIAAAFDDAISGLPCDQVDGRTFFTDGRCRGLCDMLDVRYEFVMELYERGQAAAKEFRDSKSKTATATGRARGVGTRTRRDLANQHLVNTVRKAQSEGIGYHSLARLIEFPKSRVRAITKALGMPHLTGGRGSFQPSPELQAMIDLVKAA